jgi:hypothetical protein
MQIFANTHTDLKTPSWACRNAKRQHFASVESPDPDASPHLNARHVAKVGTDLEVLGEQETTITDHEDSDGEQQDANNNKGPDK